MITWYTGSVTGHPLAAALRATTLDLIAGSEELSCGKVMLVQANPWGGCSMGFGHLVSARQVGDVLTINNCGADDVLNCQSNFVRQAGRRCDACRIAIVR